MLELQNIHKTFAGPSGPVRALDGVSLTVRPGEFVAIRGASGSGKSTLLLIAGALQRPDDGAVLIDGQDVYGGSPADRAKLRATRIGFVFQQYHLVPYLSVVDNVMAPALATSGGVDAAARSRATEAVNRLGLSPRIAHRPSELSAGERQRTALARAMVNQPSLLLADEPTGNLDGDNARIILDELSAFTQRGGAVLLVTHDSNAAAAAGKVLTMEQGKLRA